MRKICVITGTRADYGLLREVMREIRESPELELQVVATGMHFSPEFGTTYKAIEEDGHTIDARVEMLLSSDTPVGVSKSMGLATIGMADALDRLKPDILLVLGDRFEILAAAQAALIARIPIAHLAGGDTTEGAFDEAIRHAITKMSQLHFTTNSEATRRVRQLGEDPARIFEVGSPGLDRLRQLPLLSRSEFERSIGMELRPRNLLVTYHPETLDPRSIEHARALFSALDAFGEDVGLIVTGPNADPGGRAIAALIDDFVTKRSHATFCQSLGELRYLSAISHVDAVIGNSSSGLYEVPSFKKPTVNIGNRQKGRLKASSVIDCEPTSKAIINAIGRALELDCSATVNPYGDGHAASRIIDVLQSVALEGLVVKRFVDVGVDHG